MAIENGGKTTLFGIFILAITSLNERPFALFTGMSGGKPVTPLIGIIVGAILVIYGVLSMLGIVSGLTWNPRS